MEPSCLAQLPPLECWSLGVCPFEGQTSTSYLDSTLSSSGFSWEWLKSKVKGLVSGLAFPGGRKEQPWELGRNPAHCGPPVPSSLCWDMVIWSALSLALLRCLLCWSFTAQDAA